MISYHFSRSEFACKCGCGFDTVDVELIKVLEDTAEYFREKMKASYIMVLINSGCRCTEHNDKIQKQYNPNYIKGTSKSTHLSGQGADFRLKALIGRDKIVIPASDVVEYLVKKYPDKYGIGRYTGRTHIDVKTGQARRWYA